MGMKRCEETELLTSVLKDVSRSFYLSLRMLPQPMRRGAGIGYLLARASDTIADTAAVSVAWRMGELERFRNVFSGNGVWETDAAVMLHCTAGERALMARLQDVFGLFSRLPDGERALVRDVVEVIISGQMLDVVRLAEVDGMHLESDEELWDYCDRVAGCVGEFWTRLGYLTMGYAFSQEPIERMCVAGKSLGRGLQLVNLLRDLPEDLRNGRYYLPRTRGLEEKELMREMRRWLYNARNCVADGLIYASHLRDRRARAASVLPALLAEDTIELLERASWTEWQKRVKVGRLHVFRAMAEAMIYR